VKALDFTTYYISSVNQADVIELRNQGYSHAILGFDSNPASIDVAHMFIDNGFTWDAYRVIYSDREPEPDVDDVCKGIHMATRSLADLPGFVWLDIEARPQIPAQYYVTRAMDRLDSQDVKPDGTMVRAGIYSGAWVWQSAGWGNWDEPAKRGYYLWANAKQPLWGGWTEERYIGAQYEYNVNSPIGLIDSSQIKQRAVCLLSGY
jgi:hypothetical protein